MNKSIPTICLILAFVCGISAYFLWTASTFVASDVIAQKEETEQSKKGVIDKTKILIVPGHDDEFYGTEYQGVREADLNLIVAEKLYDLLQDDTRFNIQLTRNKLGYKADLGRFLRLNKEDIEILKAENRMIDEIHKPVDTVDHVLANDKVALKLFGINKWADEKKFDLVLHIHFNNFPGSQGNKKYHGFSIYIPQRNYQNHEKSKRFADLLRVQLATEFLESNLPLESGIVIEDSHLIAVGPNNSLKSPAVLVEYGYIYEDQFNNGNSDDIFQKLAEKTYNAILENFNY